MKIRVIKWAFLAILVVRCSANSAPNSYIQDTEDEAVRKLQVLEKKAQNGVESLIKKALPYLLRYSSEVEMSDKCLSSLLKTINAIRDLKMWAAQMLESTGLPGGGILSGTASALGNYQQCTSVVIPEVSFSKESKPPTTGQYCVISVRPPLPPRPKKLHFMKSIFKNKNATFKTEVLQRVKNLLFNMYESPYKLAVCIPSTCTEQDITNLLQPLSAEFGIYTNVESCDDKYRVKMDKIQFAIIMALFSLVVVNILLSIADEITRNIRERKIDKPARMDTLEISYMQEIMQCFSVRRNFQNIFTIRPVEKRSFECMKGMKYFSTTWIVLGHSYLLYDRMLAREAIQSRIFVEDFMSHIITSSMMSLEGFLFINATLLSYTMIKHYDIQKVYSPISYLIRRALRVIPSILVAISLVVLVPILGSGPDFRKPMEHESGMCRQKWWTHVIFIGNFVKYDRMCLANAWYYSAEFQCSQMGVIYLFILFKCKVFAKWFLGFMVLIAVVSTGVLSYVFQYPPTYLATIVDDKFFANYVNGIYFLPNIHFGVYAGGLFLGTLFARNPSVKLPKWSLYLGWPIIICLGVAMVFGMYPYNNGREYTVVEAVIFSSVQKTVWGGCLLWVVLVCYTGSGGVVNYLLSMPIFQPLLRLSNLIYLLHTLLILYSSRLKQGLVDSTHNERVFFFMGILLSSHLFALGFRLLLESPLIQLGNVYDKWMANRKTPTKSSNLGLHDVKNVKSVASCA